ncbi:hypothetical protein PRIPAC_88215 [Pristionchus pacificus]|uniref:Phosphotransferase n=1 Tax=Pristionchus pacificus TaxID=54126 RepID=A0A2A6CVB1_PRIPA|nr:hypothetical protein PRIPAC_88215 [Pristionchus pacificus]|eukprot:PDM82115.1 phosphotransferase [Pristionchus pacificus]
MSANECILDTTVAWTDFERKIREGLSTDARLGPNKFAGHTSRCCLIACDWVGDTASAKPPSKVVLKITSVSGLRAVDGSLPDGRKMFDYDDAQWKSMERTMIRMHNIEAASYNFFAPFGEQMIPKKYYGERIGKGESGQLCLEYIDNSRMMNFHEEHSVEQVRQIARALGKLQACSLKKAVTARELQMDFFGSMPQFWSFETYTGMFKGILAYDCSESTKNLMTKIDALLTTYYGVNLATTVHKQMGFRPVIVHGDLHTGNVLIDKDTGDLASIIDWQITHLGVGVEDLHRIALSALMPESRREVMPSLIAEMYNSMIENLHGVKPPYTFETAIASALGLAVSTLRALFRQYIYFADQDEVKISRQKIKLDKIIGSLEDVLEFDTKNKKQIGNLKFTYSSNM